MNELARQLSKVILINRLLGTNAAISERDTQKAVEILEGKHMRILKGYSKEEQKELEYNKKNMSCNDLLHNITYFPANVGCNPIKDKYDNADTDERISIIRDILDFYADKAKFAEPKYYIHFIKSDEGSYLNITSDGGAELDNKFEFDGWQTKFTYDEVVAIDSRYVPFMEEAEDDE